MTKKLRVTIDGYPVVHYYNDHQALVQALGTESKYHTTKDGYLIYHPINPNIPIRAEWVEVENS